MRLEGHGVGWRQVWCLAAIILLLPFVAVGQDEDDDFIDPTRPSVSESATVQRAGVLQLEYGGDSDFRSPEFHSQQSGSLNLQFAASNRLRLDLDVETFVSQKDRMGARATGVGDVSLGFKAIARERPKERLAIGFSYSIKLPTAGDEEELGSGRVDHNLRLIFNRSLGKTDFVVNFSYLNVGRDDSRRRASGAQAIFTVQRELPKSFGVIGEVYGQSVDDEGPRGLYVLTALTYRVNRRLRLDVGARPGFGRDVPRVGVFAGLTVGVADFYRR